MRISDWSSDVCSSDLFGCHTVAGRNRDDGAAPSRPSLATQARAPDVARAPHAIHRRTASFGRSDDCGGRRSGDGPDLLCGHVATSEEHTSELQSLMRSSYSVSCLKNKTLHHDRPHNTHNYLH